MNEREGTLGMKGGLSFLARSCCQGKSLSQGWDWSSLGPLTPSRSPGFRFSSYDISTPSCPVDEVGGGDRPALGNVFGLHHGLLAEDLVADFLAGLAIVRSL